jgi:alpha-beta hydrolase superfamily lysophospholipase
VAATFAAVAKCFDPQALRTLHVPTLLLAGTEETIVEFAAFHRWVQAASAHAKAEVQLRLIQGARHELFSEIPAFYEPAVAAVRHWLKEFLS